MFEYVLKKIKEKIRDRKYVMTLHAEEEMNDDGLTIFDIEHCLLTGEIKERQKDKITEEWKYLVTGGDLNSRKTVVVCKNSPAGNLVIITVYLDIG